MALLQSLKSRMARFESAVCIEDYPYRLSLDEAHFYQALAETAVTVYAHNHSLLSGLKLR